MIVLTGEPTAEKILCLWAERKYGLINVTRVKLEDNEDWGWSEYTPGEGHTVRVTVYSGDHVAKHDQTDDSSALTIEVLAALAGVGYGIRVPDRIIPTRGAVMHLLWIILIVLAIIALLADHPARPSMSDVKRMDIKQFRELGYLQEANRQFFHPHGLALEIVADDETGDCRLGGIWDYRADPEGIIFGLGGYGDSRERAERVAAERRRHFPTRVALFHPELDADYPHIVQGPDVEPLDWTDQREAA